MKNKFYLKNIVNILTYKLRKGLSDFNFLNR